MIYYKVTNSDGDMIFCTTIENDAYFFVINHFINHLNDNIHNYRSNNISNYYSTMNVINSTVDAINHKEYESAYFFCKDYMGFDIEIENVNIQIPIVTPKITKALNALNKEMVFK